MRVLRVSHSATVPQWRGRERALRARGVDVTVLAAREWHAGGARVVLDGDHDLAVGVRTWGRHPALFVFDPRPIWSALAQSWDLIDLHEEPFALATAEVLALKALRRNRAPYVLYTAQNIRKRYPVPFRWLERRALRRAAGISACNADAARITVEKGFPGNPQVIPLGIDPADFAATGPAGDRDPDDAVTVGFLGRLVAEKGVIVLLDALAASPGARARIAGAGPLAEALPDLVAARGLSGRVEILGPIDPSAVAQFYRSVDVLAVPSIATSSWTEQFGRVAVEAMAAGTPVVSSDAGALPDVVGSAGIVVAEGDPAALAAALAEAAGPRREELVSAGRRRAAECSWEAVADRYMELYDEATRAPRTTPAPGIEVVVVAYGSPELLRQALEPVTGLPVTVVDNSSLAVIAQMCGELGVRYLDPGANLGFGAAVNVALRDRLVSGADLLLLNPDARIDAEAVAALQAALHADDDTASVGPAQVDDEGHEARVLWPFPSPWNAWVEAVGLSRLQRGPRFVIGSVMLLRAEALAQVGEFDERFFLYAEETDWAYRAHLLGWRHRLVPDVRAVHVGAGTGGDPRRRETHFHASLERYLRKHFGRAGWQCARLAMWGGAAARSLVLAGERRAAARRRAVLLGRGPVRVEKALNPERA